MVTNLLSPDPELNGKATMIKLYGVDHNWKSSDPKLNGTLTKIEHYGENYQTLFLEKGKNTRLIKYGDMYYSNHEKARRTMLERYGVENYFQSEYIRNLRGSKEVLEKAYLTKLRNNTFNKSEPEKLLYQYLVSKFGFDDVIWHYKDKR